MTVILDTQLTDYVLETEIGRGDLTLVYRAHRKDDEDVVAVKVVAPQFTFDDYFVRRFLDMARQAARLEHPNIVRTYEARQENGNLFLVRQFAEARPLVQVLAEEGPFSPQRTLAVARQIAAALDYAHQKSIMHGDLSANRVFLEADDHVLVADFGQTQAMVGTSLVKQGFAVGAPETMAPERVHGQGPSRQSDLYSLGVLCYQMLNGEPPFIGEPATMLHAQAYEQPRPLHTVNPGVSLRLSEVVGRMLSKGLELRYTTASEFTRALTVAAEGTSPVRVTSTSTGPLTGPLDDEIIMPTPWWQRPWLWIALAVPAALLLLFGSFAAMSAWLAWQPTNPSVAASTETQTQTNRVPAASEAILESDAAAGPAQPPAAESSAPETQPAADSDNPGDTVMLVQPTAAADAAAVTQPSPTAGPSPTITPTPTNTPTPAPLPTPGPPVIAADSPFTNLTLAHAITADNEPNRIGTSFAPNSEPIYLFFDYGDIDPGVTWTHRWTWADTELEAYNDVWPDSYFEAGTAWVFYRPVDGFAPGPYQVTLEIEGQVVATATFVVEPDGL